MTMADRKNPENVFHVVIDGELDLHTFNPSELGTLVDEYIDACREKGIYNIRIIHGKGTGALRRSVHKLLERNRFVINFGIDGGRSGWGVTTATLQKN